MLDEMAHYACGCFDAEIFSSYGWVECVGLADRSAYDLSVHQKASGQNLSAWIQLPQTIEKDVTVVVPNKQLLGKQFKKDAQSIILHLETLKDERAIDIKNILATNGSVEIQGQLITADMIKVEVKKEKITGRGFIPNVIEPAFGIGRILYSILDGSYYVRPEDEQRGVLRLKPRVAPFLTTVLPLLSDDKILAKVYEIENILKKKKITSKLDVTSVAIGRRYARTDELGIPFGITVDFLTFEGTTVDTITLRERDSTQQVRVPIAEICELLWNLYDEEISWKQVSEKYPVVTQKEDTV
jgi:glycyl-tRNA synthetase